MAPTLTLKQDIFNGIEANACYRLRLERGKSFMLLKLGAKNEEEIVWRSPFPKAVDIPSTVTTGYFLLALLTGWNQGLWLQELKLRVYDARTAKGSELDDVVAFFRNPNAHYSPNLFGHLHVLTLVAEARRTPAAS